MSSDSYDREQIGNRRWNIGDIRNALESSQTEAAITVENARGDRQVITALGFAAYVPGGYWESGKPPDEHLSTTLTITCDYESGIYVRAATEDLHGWSMSREVEFEHVADPLSAVQVLAYIANLPSNLPVAVSWANPPGKSHDIAEDELFIFASHTHKGDGIVFCGESLPWEVSLEATPPVPDPRRTPRSDLGLGF